VKQFSGLPMPGPVVMAVHRLARLQRVCAAQVLLDA
jgi:hypothetical protein